MSATRGSAAPMRRGPVQDESGALDPLDALAMAEVEGRIVQPRDVTAAANERDRSGRFEDWPA